MKTFPRPDIGIWTQTNRSDVYGDLWASFGIDLQSNLGALRLGNRLKINTNVADQANLGLPQAFAVFDNRVWCMAGSRMFKNSDSSSNDNPNYLSPFVEDTSSGAVTTFDSTCDMQTFNNALVVSTPTTVLSKANDTFGTGAWTDRSANLTSGSSHKIAYLKKTNRLYVASSDRNIKSLDTSWTVVSPGSAYAIDLGESPDAGAITTMEASDSTIWIGTIRRQSAAGSDPMIKTSVFEWDGISSSPTREYKIDAMAVCAIDIINNIPHILDSNGVWSKFNGNGFTEVSRLPIKDNQLLGETDAIDPTAWLVHFNGLAHTKNGSLLAFIGNKNQYLRTTTASVNENLPAGIWEGTEDNGFVHKHSISLDRLTSSTNTDYGQNRISSIGAMGYALLSPEVDVPLSSIICGCTYYTDASTTTNAIFVESPNPYNHSTYPEGQKLGYIVTSFQDSDSLVDVWSNFYAKHKKFIEDADEIQAKYRTTEEEATVADATWADTNIFTTSTDLTGKEGYEIEVLSGKGGGWHAHITSVYEDAGTYTITLDDSFAQGSGTARIRIQNWTKIEVDDGMNIDELKNGKIDENAVRLQLKCVMKFTGNMELRKMYLVSSEHAGFQ